MGKEFKVGCSAPRKTSNLAAGSSEMNENKDQEIRKENKSLIKVGKPVPSFEAQGYQNGEFVNFNLEDFRGKWVLLCFYPGDFTFV